MGGWVGGLTLVRQLSAADDVGKGFLHRGRGTELDVGESEVDVG